MPIKIDIIKHRNEIDGKSTASHAAILAPEDVKIYTYPNIPDYRAEEKIVLIYPGSDSQSLSTLFDNIEDEILKNLNNENITNKDQSETMFPITKAVFIDSTWNQSRGIYKDDRIQKLPCLIIQNRISQFWRHQKGSPRWYLSTIEAIHQLLVEIHCYKWGISKNYQGHVNCINNDYIKRFVLNDSKSAYNGQYDNLLFFFKHMYNLIHTYYDHDQLYAYKRRLL